MVPADQPSIETLQAPGRPTSAASAPTPALLSVRDALCAADRRRRRAGLPRRRRSSRRRTASALLVESEVGGRAALLVDAIHGQRQVVIKSLEANYRPSMASPPPPSSATAASR